MKKRQTFYALAQSANDENVYDMYLYDEIFDGLKIDWETWDIAESDTSGKAFRDRLAKIPAEAEINLYINSDGGDVYEAAAIYSNLARHKGKVTGIVDGRANSAAFTVLQAADHRVMYNGTSAIIHNAWTMAIGNSGDLRQAADQLDALMSTIIDVLMERCTISRDDLIELLDAETLLTPQSAMACGLIDEIRQRTREDKLADGAQQRINDLKRQIADMAFKAETLETFTQVALHPAKAQERNLSGVGFNAFFNS